MNPLSLQHLQNRPSCRSGGFSVIAAPADLIVGSDHKGMTVVSGIPILLPDLFNMTGCLLLGMHRKYMGNKTGLLFYNLVTAALINYLI